MREHLVAAISEVCTALYDLSAEVQLTRPEEQFGDFATNVALQLSKQLGKNPREIAEALAVRLKTDLAATVKEVTVAGPGFINLTVNDDVLANQSIEPIAKPFQDKTVVIETNNPNPFKAMHIGHAYNAIVADTLANLIEAGGAQTNRVSYHGDIGLHVGKSMYSLLHFIDGDITKLEAVKPEERNSFMSKMYAEGSKAYKEDDQAKLEIDALTKMSFTLEDPLYAKVYQMCKDWSFKELDIIVGQLNNKPTVKRFLESEADERGVAIVRDNVPDIFQESDGALVFPGSKYGSFDNVFVTSHGLGLYGARDLGLIQLKNEAFHPDKSYVVTAEEQRDYFKGVIAAAELCMPELRSVTVNISHGTVKLSTGKMSSRSGDVIEIAWLFDRLAEAISERGGTPDDDLVAGALRYQFLKVRIGGDVIFDIGESVSIQGNSGSYLQYAHARACSILAKVSELTPVDLADLEADERSLLRKISEYTEVVNIAITELMPHHICTYLYELAQVFNRFYEHNRVLDDERETIRLEIVRRYADTLNNGLQLLNIPAPERL